MPGRTRHGGNAFSYAAGVVFFGISFVMSTVVAIIFKTQIEAARLEAAEATEQLTRVVTSNELNLPEIVERKSDPQGLSIVGSLLDENKTLKRWINASPRSATQAIKAEILAADVPQGQTLLGQVRQLRAELAADRKKVKKIKGHLAQLNEQIPLIEEAKKTLGDNYERAVKQLQAELTKIQAGQSKYEQAIDQQRQALKKQLASARDQDQKTVNAQRNTITQQDQQIVILKQRFEDVLRQFAASRSGGEDPTRHYDATILSVHPEDNLVYIDLGREDHLLLGMTLEVFDQDMGVVVDEFGELRGIATIEVVRVSDSTASARIVRGVRGKVIHEGDLAANVVYDPDTQHRFYVFGEFDIDRTNQFTATDRRRIQAMINLWGGMLAKELTYQVDFLVLGNEPELPEPLPAGVIDPLTIEAYEAKRQQFEQFQDLIVQAKALSIPIMNQNRFLALVGYYRR